MKVTDIAFTGYPVTSMRRGRDFYEKKLGLSPTDYELEKGASWVEYEIRSGTLAITDIDLNWQRRDNGPSVALEVDDIYSEMRVRSASAAIVFIGSEVPVEGNEDPFMQTISKHVGDLPNVIIVSSAGNASLTT